jgi:hypothetical protein
VALSLLAAAPTVASAAPTSGQFAAEVVYRNWNNRCGEGTGWWCSERRQRLENYPYRRDSRGNVTSWDIHYCWVDRSAFSWKQWCVYIEANTQNMLGFTKGSNKILNSKG